MRRGFVNERSTKKSVEKEDGKFVTKEAKKREKL